MPFKKTQSADCRDSKLVKTQPSIQTVNLDVTDSQPDRPITPSIAPQISPDTLSEAEKCFYQEDYRNAIQIAQRAIADSPHSPHSFELHHLIAHAHANLGENDQAKHCCEKAIAINSLAVEPYYLLAHIAREQGLLDQAKKLLKRIVYLAPTSITAYLELSSLYTQQGDTSRAKKMQVSALELMQ